MKTKQNGFTLIELLVVIAIIAILAIAIAVGYQSVRNAAQDAKRIEIARNIATAQEIHYTQNGNYASLAKLVEEGLMQSHPDNGQIAPHADGFNAGRWSSGYWVNTTSSNRGFYVRVLNNGDDFCCTQTGCLEIENHRNCN